MDACPLGWIHEDDGAVTETIDSDRVAVYIDFDNIVISRYDQLHGGGAWRRDNARDASAHVAPKLEQARIDIGEIIDFTSSFGTVAVTRAYADWSVPANAEYRGQLVERAVDLTQMFPASGTKNGADIRLAVDVLEDLFRLPDITHVVIVAGDSDYVALAQRCKRLGRVVVAIGVTGSTSKVLISACDAFEYYDDILGDDPARIYDAPSGDSAAAPSGGKGPAATPAEEDFASSDGDEISDDAEPAGQAIGRPGAGRLLIRALGLVAKDEDGWAAASTVKSQMKRLNPQFAEKTLGFASFTEFVKSRLGQVELREDGQQRHLRLRPDTDRPRR